MTKIILCADDYGQSEAVSRGILALIGAGRLSAASCMTEGGFWESSSKPLAEFRERIDIGLHFNLTHPFASQGAPPLTLKRIIASALSGRVDKTAVAAALNNQLDRFEMGLKSPPDFVDGHQHVHALPGIRRVLWEVLSARYPERKPYLRSVNPTLALGHANTKLAFLKSLNAGFAAGARRAGFKTNARIAGIYSLKPEANFSGLMRKWLRAARAGDLVICHPGEDADDGVDPIAGTRPIELEFLKSAAFGELLAQYEIQLARFRDL
ncbi:MAG TPA: ChbG/HpnK family deacetylase [Planctomycetota bacterium]|nr:ChbG/HpnK family deacetylase [Planctomycetota bacterium]